MNTIEKPVIYTHACSKSVDEFVVGVLLNVVEKPSNGSSAVAAPFEGEDI